MKPLRYFYRHHIPLDQRGVGQYKLGQLVWAGRDKARVIEVISYGMYPSRRKGLRVRGYYREHESYVVKTLDGRVKWPRVGSLRPTSESEK